MNRFSAREDFRSASIGAIATLVFFTGCQTQSDSRATAPQEDLTLGPTVLQETSPGEKEYRLEPEELVDEPPAVDWPAAVQDGLQLSLEEAVFLALRNNRELSVQELSPVIAGTFEELERAVYDPLFFLEGGYSRDRGVQVTPGLGDEFELESEGNYLEAGIARQFTTGTDVEASVRHDRNTTSLTPEQHEARAGLSVTQALLQGRDRDANLASIRQARIDTQISEYELRGFSESLISQVETAYWNYSLSSQQLEIFERSLEVAQQQRADTQARVEAGTLARTQLAAVRAEEARRRQDLIAARAEFNRSRVELLRRMNPATREHWQTPIAAEPAQGMVDPVLEPVGEHVVLALRMRPELNEARLQVERNELEVVLTENGLLPRLDLFLNLGKSGFADSFGDAARGIDGPSYDLSGGLRLEYPIGNRGARASHRAATVSRHQAALAVENLAQLVEADIRTAYLDVEEAHEQISASAATRELQEEVLEAEEARFDAGVSTSLLVAQAQRDLLEAELAEVQAVVSYRQALTDLYRLEGSLLRRRGISAPGAPL